MLGALKKLGLIGMLICCLLGVMVLESAAYEVYHPYSIRLRKNQVVRGKWKWDVHTAAKVDGYRVIDRQDKNMAGPFDPGYANTKQVQIGNIANAKSEIDFKIENGSHRVSGDARAGGVVQWSKSYAKSVTGVNFGRVQRDGSIRWSPRWKADKIQGGRHVTRDPVDLTLTDLDSGLSLSARLFDVQANLGAGGSTSWENGRLQLTGIDGFFELNMDSPYLAVPGGRMWLVFDEQGQVTESEATGIFAGKLPTVGRQANLDMHIGDGEGYLDLDFDFGQSGQSLSENLEMEGDFGGDGVTVAVGGPVGTSQDFSTFTLYDQAKLFAGTRFTPSLVGLSPLATLLPDPDGDPFDGFLRLTPQIPFAQTAIAFDNTSPAKFDRIQAEFDFRLSDNDALDGQGDGFSFALLPARIYGNEGALPQADIGAEPNLLGALGVGFDTFNSPGDDCFDCFGDRANHVSLHFDGQQIGQSRLVDPELDLDFVNGQWNTAVLDLQDIGDGALVSLTLIDGTDGSEHQVYQQEYVPGFAFESMRAAFAASTMEASDDQDIDNLFIDFSCSLCSDFNGDFVVDQTDLAYWQAAYGLNHLADANGDGESNGADFLQFQQEYTGGGFVAQAVPEPTSIVLLFVSLCLTIAGRSQKA